MGYKEFGKDLKNKKLKNICILWGKEAFLTEWAEGEIIKTYSNEVSRQFDLSEFDGEESQMSSVVEACETMPLFSEKKLVIVSGLPSLEGRTGGTGDDELLIDYLKNPSERTMLVFVCGEKLDKRREVYKAAAKNADIYEFGRLTQSELAAWIKKRIKSHGKIIEPTELNRLISLSGYYDKESEYTLYHFENDISKVILHCTADVIRPEDIDNTVSGNINTNVFMMIDYIAAGDKKSAFNMLNDMFLYGQNEYGIIALLYRQYENVLNVRQLTAAGMGRQRIAELLNTKDFIVTKWSALGNKYSEKALKDILKGIYKTDKLIKSGDMESRMALEVLIASI